MIDPKIHVYVFNNDRIRGIPFLLSDQVEDKLLYHNDTYLEMLTNQNVFEFKVF